MSSIMTVRDLCLWYGKAQALKNINMEIPEKSITALIGPSGCGKSTFLKTLNRMNDLVSSVKITGEVMYNGENIYDNSVDVNELRKNIGMVFQKPNPFPMSIYDNIAYGPRTHGIRSKATLTPGCSYLGGSKGQAEKKCFGTIRRSAAKALYCESTCSRAADSPDG